MGCCTSKDDAAPGVDLTDLAPVRPGQHQQGPSQPFPELTKGDLELALRQVAQYLHKRGRNVRLVVVGGAVSTILLETRRSTHDVDFFAETLSRNDSKLLLEAADIVRQQPGSQLEEDWINNRTIYFIQPPLRQDLTRKGFEQNDVVFQAPGLTLYAAPWSYAFVSKLDRIQGGGFRSHDPLDAAVYLDRWLRKSNQHEIQADEIAQWVREYQLRVASGQQFTAALNRINDAFQQKFGRRPIQT